MPVSRAHSATAGMGMSRRIPRASRTSAEPDLEVDARLPCLTTVAPVPAMTRAAMVEMLTVFCWSPPVPTMSTAWGSMSTVSALAIMPAASAPSSSGVSPLEWRAVRKDARIGCSVWPVMIWSIAQATSVSVRFWCLTSWLRMYFQVISCVVMC